MIEQPAQIGRYVVTAEIGRGAMGVVYRAIDPMLERTVAIKTINMALDPGEMAHFEKRFTVEARAAARLNHPNIVTIHDIGRSGDLAYMAMEFLEGPELRDLIVRNKLALDRALDIAAQVADGLAYAHEHDIVHRDIKPANIMILRDGRVKITDFGIARMRTVDLRTQTGVVLGSPRYLSPEQVLGKDIDGRADIFSLGVIIYEAVTGRAPFSGDDIHSLLFQIVNVTPPPPSALNPDLPPMLDLIVGKTLTKSVDDRYASAAELASDLRACLQYVRTSRVSPTVPASERTVDLFVDTLPAPYSGDEIPTVPGYALPARGLAKEFDSMAATMRLAAQTGAITDPGRFATNPGISRDAVEAAAVDTGDAQEYEPPARPAIRALPWSKRDRRIFLGATIGALVMGAVIVFI